MTRAYVLVKTEVGQAESVVRELRARPGVKTVDVVIGPYDIIAVVEAADLNGIGKLVLDQVHSVSGVENTLTCPVVEVPAGR